MRTGRIMPVLIFSWKFSICTKQLLPSFPLAKPYQIQPEL